MSRTNIWFDELHLLLALLQLLLQLSELNADHLQVALIEGLQLVHDEGHVVDLGQTYAVTIQLIKR